MNILVVGSKSFQSWIRKVNENQIWSALKATLTTKLQTVSSWNLSPISKQPSA